MERTEGEGKERGDKTRKNKEDCNERRRRGKERNKGEEKVMTVGRR